MSHTWKNTDEIEVDATPEQVWEAIASGPGIDSWLMGRTTLDPRLGGTVRTDLGGMGMESTITAWEPPTRFAYRGKEGEDGRFIAYEFLVQGRATGSTVVRLVADGFLPGDDWEAEFEAMVTGGRMYFRTLAEYVTHFAGRTAVPVTAVGPEVTDWPPTMARLLAELGLTDPPAVGDRVRCAPAGLPPFDGVVDYATPEHLGVRADDALYRFTKGFFGRLVVGHHVFAGPTGPEAEQAWAAWLARLSV